jgi:hypothetical protein
MQVIHLVHGHPLPGAQEVRLPGLSTDEAYITGHTLHESIAAIKIWECLNS